MPILIFSFLKPSFLLLIGIPPLPILLFLFVFLLRLFPLLLIPIAFMLILRPCRSPILLIHIPEKVLRSFLVKPRSRPSTSLLPKVLPLLEEFLKTRGRFFALFPAVVVFIGLAVFEALVEGVSTCLVVVLRAWSCVALALILPPVLGAVLSSLVLVGLLSCLSEGVLACVGSGCVVLFSLTFISYHIIRCCDSFEHLLSFALVFVRVIFLSLLVVFLLNLSFTRTRRNTKVSIVVLLRIKISIEGEKSLSGSEEAFLPEVIEDRI